MSNKHVWCWMWSQVHSMVWSIHICYTCVRGCMLPYTYTFQHIQDKSVFDVEVSIMPYPTQCLPHVTYLSRNTVSRMWHTSRDTGMDLTRDIYVKQYRMPHVTHLSNNAISHTCHTSRGTRWQRLIGYRIPHNGSHTWHICQAIPYATRDTPLVVQGGKDS